MRILFPLWHALSRTWVYHASWRFNSGNLVPHFCIEQYRAHTRQKQCCHSFCYQQNSSKSSARWSSTFRFLVTFRGDLNTFLDGPDAVDWSNEDGNWRLWCWMKQVTKISVSPLNAICILELKRNSTLKCHKIIANSIKFEIKANSFNLVSLGFNIPLFLGQPVCWINWNGYYLLNKWGYHIWDFLCFRW